MLRPGNSVSVKDAIVQLFPNHLGEHETWVDLLENLDIETVGDVCIIETRLWDELELPKDLKQGLTQLRMTTEGETLPAPSPQSPQPQEPTSTPQEPVPQEPSKPIPQPQEHVPQAQEPAPKPIPQPQELVSQQEPVSQPQEPGPQAQGPAQAPQTAQPEQTASNVQPISEPSSTTLASEAGSTKVEAKCETGPTTTEPKEGTVSTEGGTAEHSKLDEGKVSVSNDVIATTTAIKPKDEETPSIAAVESKEGMGTGGNDSEEESEDEFVPQKDQKATQSPKLSREPTVHYTALKPAQQREVFTVTKTNRVGLVQSRMVSFDDQAVTLRFSDMHMKLKMEVPFSQVTLNVVEGNDRKITLTFKERSRVYEVGFTDSQACSRFQSLFHEIGSGAQSKLSRQLSSPGSTRGTPKPEEVEVSAHEEYKIVKKNKFKQRQHRILVLKPTTIVLLDERRKFKKAFQYDQIHSIEIPPEDEKRATGEAEIFVVFTLAVGQRPFQCFFCSPLERSHFALCLKSYHRTLVLKEPGHVDRFVITKLATNSARVQGKRRILEVLPARSVIRSYDRIMQFKDLDISRVKGVAPDPKNNCRLYFTTTKKFVYDFTDHLARTHFLSLMFFMLDGITHQSPGKPISIFCGSWVASTCVPTKSNNWASWISPNKYDIYAIGLQKVSLTYQKDWPVQLQRMVGDHNPEFVHLSEKERDAQSKYHHLITHTAGEMLLVIFVRKPLAYKVTYVDVTSCLFPSESSHEKGAAAVCLTYEDTNLCFITSHFRGKQDKSSQRRSNYFKVLQGLKFKREGDLFSQHDHIFWFGDLNYRLDLNFGEALTLTESFAIDQLLAADQLAKELKKTDPVFLGFHEGKITFPPTHQKGITKQVTSYTDRLLWRSLHPSAVTQQEYNSAHDILGSLHRPIYSVFTVAPRSYKWAGFNTLGQIVELSLFDLLFKSMTVPAEAELLLVVSGSFLAQDFPSKTAKLEGSWSWFLTGGFRAHVQPEHLPLLHITLMLKDTRTRVLKGGKDEPIVYGYCTVPLTPNKSKFNLPFVNNGLVVGNVVGNMMVKATDDENLL